MRTQRKSYRREEIPIDIGKSRSKIKIEVLHIQTSRNRLKRYINGCFKI